MAHFLSEGDSPGSFTPGNHTNNIVWLPRHVCGVEPTRHGPQPDRILPTAFALLRSEFF